MTKNKFLWQMTGFSIACLSVMALTPMKRTSIPALVTAVACTLWLILFILANAGKRKTTKCITQ